MGRIKTKLVKRSAIQLLKHHGGAFDEDFQQNKKAIAGVAEIPSKKMRNVITGYLTRLVKQKNQESGRK